MGISWAFVAVFALSGVGMSLLSCLVGMRPKIENPLWWTLYAIWVATSIFAGVEALFSTLLVSSILAGFLNGTTSAILLDKYKENNPWHAKKMRGPKRKQRRQLVILGIGAGTVFGAIIAGIAWGIGSV